MTYVIAEPCVSVVDQASVAVCPVDSIDPDERIDCGACEPECPVSAIFPEASVPPVWAHDAEVNTLWCRDRGAATRLVDELRPEAGRVADSGPER